MTLVRRRAVGEPSGAGNDEPAGGGYPLISPDNAPIAPRPGRGAPCRRMRQGGPDPRVGDAELATITQSGGTRC